MQRRLVPLALALAGVLLSPRTSLAAEPSDRCEARKLKAAGLYAACRLKADARALLKGAPADDSACVARFEKVFTRAESAAGPGVCPNQGDLVPIGDEVLAAASEVADQLAAPEPDCPAGYRDRSPAEVLQDFFEAYDARDLVGIACSYHPDAFVFADSGILVGRSDIHEWYSSFWPLFGSASFEMIDLHEFRDRVVVRYRLDNGWIVIPDGVDAYEIRRGQIRFQAGHGLIELTGPPPS